MEDKFKQIAEKAGSLFMKVSKFFDGISQKIYEQTGKKINIGFIAISIFLVIFALSFAISILKWLTTLI